MTGELDVAGLAEVARAAQKGGTKFRDGLNYDFIAAADPTAILALIDRLAAAESAVERVRALADEWEANGESPHTDDDMDIGWASHTLRVALDQGDGSAS